MTVRRLATGVLLEPVLAVLSLLGFLSESSTLWACVGTVFLLLGCGLALRDGVRRGVLAGEAWSHAIGLKAALLAALPGLIVSAVYLLLSMIGVAEKLLIVSRVLAWIGSLAYLPVIALWQPSFAAVTLAIAVTIPAGLCLLPIVQLIGRFPAPRRRRRMLRTTEKKPQSASGL